jgi:hypothetical protein
MWFLKDAERRGFSSFLVLAPRVFAFLCYNARSQRRERNSCVFFAYARKLPMATLGFSDPPPLSKDDDERGFILFICLLQ